MWKCFEKAKRLSVKLTEAVIDGQTTDPELNQWANDNEEGKEILRKFTDPSTRRQLLSSFDNPERDLAVRQLRKILRRHRQKILFLRLSLAAVIVMCLGSLVFLWPPHPEKSAEVAQILPGSPNAVLVLSNGEQLELADITRLRETDGTAIARTKENEIAYTRDSVIVGKVDTNTLIIPRYGEYAVVLADGTVVKLNSESELRYPTSFTGDRREVFLKGEAYLEVSKSDRPFIIHTYGAQVIVYGTRLDVNSYDSEKIRVVLVEGKVGVSSEGHKEVMLEPAQLAEVRREQGITVRKNINPAYFIAWQDGYFAFEKERLEDILTVLARWYNFEVLYTRPELKDVHFTASLRKDQPLEHFLRQFEKTGSVAFRIVGNQIVVQ